jgi:hypothetical protein
MCHGMQSASAKAALLTHPLTVRHRIRRWSVSFAARLIRLKSGQCKVVMSSIRAVTGGEHSG